MTLTTTLSNSFVTAYKVSDFTVVIATPMQNDNSRAVMTSKGGAISTSKYGVSAPSSISETSVIRS